MILHRLRSPKKIPIFLGDFAIPRQQSFKSYFLAPENPKKHPKIFTAFGRNRDRYFGFRIGPNRVRIGPNFVGSDQTRIGPDRTKFRRIGPNPDRTGSDQKFAPIRKKSRVRIGPKSSGSDQTVGSDRIGPNLRIGPDRTKTSVSIFTNMNAQRDHCQIFHFKITNRTGLFLESELTFCRQR